MRLLHRQEGAAEIHFGNEGQLHSERWYRFGQRHREDGPAEIVYGDSDDQEPVETYWLNDELISKTEWEEARSQRSEGEETSS